MNKYAFVNPLILYKKPLIRHVPLRKDALQWQPPLYGKSQHTAYLQEMHPPCGSNTPHNVESLHNGKARYKATPRLWQPLL